MDGRARRVAVVAAVIAGLPVIVAGLADARTQASPRYGVRELPTLGAVLNGGNSINGRGWVAGIADLPGDTITRAALWRDGRITDLGTLGGDNSGIAFPTHDERFVVGVAETAEVNPDGEDWSCNAFFVGPPTHHDCLGFVWQDDRMHALPTLGGHNGFAAGSNDAGEIVGWAENTVRDSTCTGTQVRQFRAVVWSPGTWKPRALAPLPGDSTSAAVAINDRGEVVGISGACGTAVGGVSARHAVLWSADGQPRYLGNIGGKQWNTPDAINDQGVVAGFANVAAAPTEGSLYPHAFMWTARTGMRDLGTLPGDQISEAEGINDRDQIVGLSCLAGFVNCRAFLWEDGHMWPLNDLVGPHSGTLTNAGDINDRGEITGSLTDDGVIHAYVATPIGG